MTANHIIDVVSSFQMVFFQRVIRSLKCPNSLPGVEVHRGKWFIVLKL